MTKDEIKLRIITNQHLADKKPSEPGHDRFTVARDLCGIQAQFMVNVFHALKIRCNENLTAENMGYSDATKCGLVKNWTIRGTVHVFDVNDLPLFKHKGNDSDYLKHNWQGNCCITAERQRFFAEYIVKKIGEGVCEREELKKECYNAGMTETEGETVFEQWGGTIRGLAERGFICYKVQEKKAFTLCPPFIPMKNEEAELEIARRYFTNYGPATIKDAAYFLGTTQTKVKTWLDKLPVISADSDVIKYFYIENGKEYSADIPDCILLAGFDQLMLGYEKHHSIFLPSEYIRGIFNLSGIVFPAVLLHRRVVGKWKKKGPKLLFTLFETIDERNKQIIINTAEKLWNNIKKIEWE
jgi:hypothetical protein